MEQKVKAIPHNSKCRYGERGAAAAKPKAQIILDAAKVSAASGGNSEPKQGQRSQSARGFCPRSTMRVPQPDIIEHFGNADAVPQLPERCLSRKAGIVRCCLKAASRPACGNVPRWGGWLLYRGKVEIKNTLSPPMPKPRKAWYNDGRINAETNTQNTKRTQERKDHVLSIRAGRNGIPERQR